MKALARSCIVAPLRRRIQTFALVFGCSLGCSAEHERIPVAVQRVLPDLDLRRCRPGPGISGRPTTIDEAVALLNSLPEPVTVGCFVEALDRPLHIELSKSGASAQPARGERSPRVFIFSGDKLVITIVLDGMGRDLIEFGETVAPRRTVKGELEFPLDASVAADDPYTRIRNPDHGNITTCFVCHDGERDEPGYPGGRSSMTLRPRPASLVAVGTLEEAYRTCDPQSEPTRCDLLQALVPWGPLVHRSFDETLPVF